MMTSNGHSGVHHEADEAIDNLYAWMPPMTAATPPCPEAAFSITLKGKLGGQEALLTARGQSAEEFRRNLESIKGLLDQPQPHAPGPTQGQSEGWCAVHQVAMKENVKDGRRWWSHKVDGQWCKGKP